MHRFLIERDSTQDGRITVAQDDARHMLQVLRLKVGATFVGFDGSGLEHEIKLTSIDKNRVQGEIIRTYDPGTEPGKKVILFQGVPKMDKMDWIIQKSVELGVTQIVPVITQNSVMQFKDKNIEVKLQRWNRISREACKQCGRVTIPEVKAPLLYRNALELWSEQVKSERNHIGVFCYENEGKKCLKDLFKCYNIDCVNMAGIFIGPEGGFSGEEIRIAEEYHISPVSLGKRILRTETAAIAVLSVVMHEMGEWTK
ncbi:MAG: 16S rRNA (uracil(1498)-N(3))-methyltransferase [Clostridiaceae bacterium]|nr:16S rRNA (uracil(1498)-N(3))-methyltransferase [Clostridiaceae bacterium]